MFASTTARRDIQRKGKIVSGIMFAAGAGVRMRNSGNLK